MPARLAILDVDGTLVDSTYHHALAWHRAFSRHHLAIPMWRIHRAIGKGGDRLVPDLAGEDAERRAGNALRNLQHDLYADLLPEVEPLEGAHELLATFKQDGWRIALASSGRADEIERYLDLLDAHDLPDAVVSSADVETTKPAPDVLQLAHEQAAPDLAPGAALVIGDATWDCEAAHNAGMTPVGVLSGGFSRAELEEAGAIAVFETLPQLTVAREQLLAATG
ncbi:MAG TPA: HAD family hydrolase [Gemmatimonadaceae bacterium]|nr:HAD family hydrolase [Gemmatimonadaceae bacterium]